MDDPFSTPFHYQIRGWDVATGLQTCASLEELQIEEVADDLEQKGLLGG